MCDYCGKNDYPTYEWDLTLNLGINKIICPDCIKKFDSQVDYCRCPECKQVRARRLGETIGAWDL